jgi:transposase
MDVPLRESLPQSAAGRVGVVQRSERDEVGAQQAQVARPGVLFMFFNKTANRMKIPWWDRSGFCLLYKRLERAGRFACRTRSSLAPRAS